jgi:hypothetical protein
VTGADLYQAPSRSRSPTRRENRGDVRASRDEAQAVVDAIVARWRGHA